MSAAEHPQIMEDYGAGRVWVPSVPDAECRDRDLRRNPRVPCVGDQLRSATGPRIVIAVAVRQISGDADAETYEITRIARYATVPLGHPAATAALARAGGGS